MVIRLVSKTENFSSNLNAPAKENQGFSLIARPFFNTKIVKIMPRICHGNKKMGYFNPINLSTLVSSATAILYSV